MRILFLCTGNSCRSQMAEGFARALAVDGTGAASAGIDPHGQNPRAIAAMNEVGIDISGQQSTRLNDAMLASADLVVTVCGDADEQCPLLPPGTRKVHWPLPDPARARGTEDEIAAEFRSVRDDIRARVHALLAEHDLLRSDASAGPETKPTL
ncbi:MAG: arsenate reductase ArsC [Halofilum sp. (in: g-proteobacteria)]